jgi:osmoprotectant transport system permease protein
VILRGIAITDGGPIIIVGAVLCAFIAMMMDWLFDWMMK